MLSLVRRQIIYLNQICSEECTICFVFGSKVQRLMFKLLQLALHRLEKLKTQLHCYDVYLVQVLLLVS